MSVLQAGFFQDEDNICRSMLNLSTVPDHKSGFPVVPYASTVESLDAQPAVCACSTKRQSPLSRSLLQEPVPKRTTLHPPSSPVTAAAEAEDPDLLGYKKLPLPPYSLSAPPPPLRRTLSEPLCSPGAVNSAAPTLGFPGFPTSPPPPIKTQPRQETCNRNIAQESYPLPETLPLLYRTVSDPNPASNRQVVAAAGTPPRPPARAHASRSPNFGESPNARRLRRMKERLKQMSQWANHVSSADDGDDTLESEYLSIDNAYKEESDNLPQEAVFVEKSGECLVLHFKCPCGDGYQILLSGNSCYYKLTNFRNS